MELFVVLLIFHINFDSFKAYQAAPTDDDSKSDDAEIRSELESVPGIDEQMIQAITTLLHKYDNNTVNISINVFFISAIIVNLITIFLQLGLMTIALQGDTCIKNRIKFPSILKNAMFITKIQGAMVRMNGGTYNREDEILNHVQDSLSKTLTPEKVQNAIELFRSFGNRVSEAKSIQVHINNLT